MLIPDNMRIIDMTAGQLRQILSEGRLMVNPVKCDIERITTIPIEKLCELTGWSKSCIYKKTSLRQIPHHKVGKELRFDMNEINDWIKKQKRKTGDEAVNDFENRQRAIMKKIK